MATTPQLYLSYTKVVRKRGSQAINVFRDPFGIEVLDDRRNYGEERFIRIGMAGNRLLTVVYTERGENIRIISAREAVGHERRIYYSQNA